jgi:Uma2 family endonuclease
MIAERVLITADDILALGVDAHVEVVRGELREMAAAGGRHGRVGGRFAFHLSSFGMSEGIGDVYTSETGVVIEQTPLTLLVPDVVFVKNEHLPAGVAPIGFFTTPPDVVVEVRSPSQTFGDLIEKVGAYLMFGVPLVLLADFDARTITAFHQDHVHVYHSGESLDCGDVLPGFSVPVDDFFP